MEDMLLRGTIGEADARFFMAATSCLVEDARRIHDLSPTAAAALGRLLTAAVMMGVMPKDGGHSVTLTVKGGGPAGTLMAVARPDGAVKGCAGQPRADLPVRGDGKLDVGGLVGRRGTLTVVRDTGAGEPYIGHCDLRSGEIAEDIAWYFTASEQQPTMAALGVLAGESGVLSAAGLIVQPLPGCDEKILEALELRAPVMGDISRHLYDFGDGEALLGGFLKGLPWRVHERIRPAYRCDCGVERVEGALAALGEQALREIAAKGETTEVCCHFCGKRYAISPERLAELLTRCLEKGKGNR